MRIVVTGAGGMLGQALVPILEADHQVTGLTRKDGDLCDEAAVTEVLKRHQPDLVIHLAAFTQVDACEIEPEKAKAWNEIATLNVARAAKQLGAAVLYTSTDYVFDGGHDRPYREDDPTNPLNVYGRSKLMGEKHLREILDRCLIVRTSWLFGPYGRNFVSTIRKLAGEKDELRIVSDQRGSPTYTRHLAQKLAELVAAGEYGVFHVTGTGNCTWFEFARKIVEFCGVEGVRLIPVSSSEYVCAAKRPAYSVLDNQRLNGLGTGLLPHWETGLKDYLEELQHGEGWSGKTTGTRSAYASNV